MICGSMERLVIVDISTNWMSGWSVGRNEGFLNSTRLSFARGDGVDDGQSCLVQFGSFGALVEKTRKRGI